MKALHLRPWAILISAVGIAIAACNPAIATPTESVTSTATSAPTPTEAPTVASGDSTRTLKVNDVERSYVLHVPPGLKSNQPAPVLLAFHGSGQEPKDIDASTGLTDIADVARFILVYPIGLEGSWNAGACCGYAAYHNIDDIAFVRQIIADLETVADVDPKRIYATGFSNGGALVYRLGCEMSDVFAGIAPVASSLLPNAPCEPQEPVSLIHIHGLADGDVLYEGGGPLDTLPIEDVITTWAKLDGCADSPKVETLVKIVKHTAYSSCQAGTAVELYAIEFQGHGWPTMSAWSGPQAIWDFFAAHPKP